MYTVAINLSILHLRKLNSQCNIKIKFPRQAFNQAVFNL